MYSVKARAILHAHLSRIELSSETLDIDRQIIVQKCPYLIQEMVSCVNQLIMLAYARRSKSMSPKTPFIYTNQFAKKYLFAIFLQFQSCQPLKPLKIA